MHEIYHGPRDFRNHVNLRKKGSQNEKNVKINFERHQGSLLSLLKVSKNQKNFLVFNSSRQKTKSFSISALACKKWLNQNMKALCCVK